jgi:hypothetical protein
MLIPDGDILSFFSQINGLIQYKSPRFWNSEARFVVAVANEFSMLLQTQIFALFSTYKTYNCIIVSQEHYVIDKGYSKQINVNDASPGMKLGVYTWFPYQNSDSCNEVNDITLLDSWAISAQGHFTKNNNLFPRKISNSLNGCPIHGFGVSEGMFATNNYIQLSDTNGNAVWVRETLDLMLLKVVLKQMNMTFVPLLLSDVLNPIDLASEMLLGKSSYIILGVLLSIDSLNTALGFTSLYYFTNIRWYVPCSVKYQRWSSIFRLFSVELWLVLIISIVTVAISTTLVGRYSCTSEWKGYKTLTSSLTKVWAVILGVSVSTMPRTPSDRKSVV